MGAVALVAFIPLMVRREIREHTRKMMAARARNAKAVFSQEALTRDRPHAKQSFRRRWRFAIAFMGFAVNRPR